jgi:hypothetical protein
MEGIEELKVSSKDIVLVTNFDLSSLEELLQLVFFHSALGRELSDKAIHDGLGGYEFHWSRFDQFVEGPCIMVGMTVGQDQFIDQAG